MPRLKIRNISMQQTPSLFDSLEMPADAVVPSRKLRFMSFGSGSSGNCSYLGLSDGNGILIDAGVAPENVVHELKRRGIPMSNIRGILITHDHSDHVRYVYKIVKKHPHIAILTTPKVLSGMFRRHSLSPRLRDYFRPVYIETPFHLGPFNITAFTTPHDGTDNVGFFLEADQYKVAVATDLGSITERVDHYMRQAQHIVIESNYDLKMLRDGRYPEYLKARIQAPDGHLDNTVTAEFLSTIATHHLKNVFLCHLSNDNNTPEIALSVVSGALTDKGFSVGDGSGSLEARQADIQVVALPRFDPSPLFTLTN